MSTRSNIIVNTAAGEWHIVYCHLDGYLDGVGRMLHERYNSQEGADALVEHGDMSFLAESCDKPSGHSYDNPVPGHTVYYGRDRGESDTQGVTVGTLSDAMKLASEEYLYVFKDGKWWFHEGDDVKELAQALE